MTDPKDLYVFFHLNKTGGTSLINHLIATYGRESIALLNDYQEQKAEKNHDTYWTKKKISEKLNAKFVLGHDANPRNCECLQKFKNIKYLTVFREPTERLLSVYNYQRSFGNIEGITATEYFEDPNVDQTQLSFYLHRFLMWPLKNICLVRKPASNKHLLEEAVNTLDRFFFIGLHENYKSDMKQLTDHLQIPEISKSFHVAGEDIEKFESQSDTLSRTFRNLFPVEFEFYDIVKEKVIRNGSPFFVNESNSGEYSRAKNENHATG